MADEPQNETEGSSADAEALEEQVEEETAEQAVADAPASEEPAGDAADAADPAAEQTAEDSEATAEPEASRSSASPEAKRKRKRLPRALRPKKTRPTRARSTERKPIVRLEKPEHERGRRQERQGKVVSDAMEKTIVVEVAVVKAHPRYKKVVRRSVKFHAHDERSEAKVGDLVRIVETRPLSRTKRWRLVEILEAAK
jgi:small subunit ribosomal protein S17